MKNVSADICATRVKQLFERIHREQMAGLPLLNKALEVSVLGFQEHEGRIIGMLITPWMMSLLRFPAQGDDWNTQALGTKHLIAFPGGTYRFMVNVLDELGVCQMYSLHSPMNRFDTQSSAIAEAQAFMEALLVAPSGGIVQDAVDEELLGKILRGEIVPPLPTPEHASKPSPTEIL